MKYGRVGLALLTAAALVTGVFPPKALADSNARIVRLSYVDGEAQIDRRDGRGFEHAFLNMPLGPGTRVATRDDGRAEIEFEDMSTVRLAPDTLVETQSLDLRTSGAKYTMVDLEDGTAYFNIRKRDDDNDFRVTTGRREFSPTGAARFRLRLDHKQVVLAVFSGEVEIIGEGSSLTVRKNETLTLDLEDPSRYFLAKGVSGDRYDDWDQERDEYRDRYARTSNYSGYSSAYSYGVSDLNYWGSYTYISGYGYMWRPNYYGVSWNPYANGAWYWYPGSGWIWVSAYPWGWMPFHYGNWFYISGHGWCWRPGNQWHHWSPVVAVHNPPPGHHAPTPPPPSGHHDPVVVGHGPATILPAEDMGPRRGVRDPVVLGKKGVNPSGGGSGVVTPGSGPTGAPSGGSGSGVGAGSGSGGSVGSGGNGRPAADPGGRPSGRGREVDLEEAIRNARERRGAGGQAGAAITNSGPASSGSGAPPSGRERFPEARRPLPPTITNDAPASSSGSSGSASSGGSGAGSSSDSGTTSAAADTSPTSGGGRSPEPRRESPRENFVRSPGPAVSTSSSAGSSSAGSSSAGTSSAGASGSNSGGSRGTSGSSASGSSGRSSPSSSPSPSSGASSSRSSSGSSAGSASTSRPSSSSGGSSSGARSSSSSSTSPKSSAGSTPQ